MEEPTIRQISSSASAFADIFGGDRINSLIKKNVTKSVNCSTAKIVGMNDAEDTGTSITKIAGTSIAGIASTSTISRFLVKPAGEGKVLCPSVR